MFEAARWYRCSGSIDFACRDVEIKEMFSILEFEYFLAYFVKVIDMSIFKH